MGDKFTRLNYILNIFYKTYVKIDDNLIQEPYTGLIRQKKSFLKSAYCKGLALLSLFF